MNNKAYNKAKTVTVCCLTEQYHDHTTCLPYDCERAHDSFGKSVASGNVSLNRRTQTDNYFSGVVVLKVPSSSPALTVHFVSVHFTLQYQFAPLFCL